MTALLFEARLVNQTGAVEVQFARVIYGVDSPEEKEKTFRAICRSRYPQLRILEPISVSPATLQ
ncbi:hypothetical protein Slin_7036 (plasmid) [Spirosoma linguale DSM 74]|uniref:Uncharacterized protein n=1 Tax=Spirosoma linguale (strain ATCC 33905 / DSM 74 / LMG 10896 / Claus 1) TaxID=504472 RepID=D2QVZ7_SPILD|nr:hypothetical protein Slin_7036 [Spirosoma linguale DSM 74]